MQRYTRRGAFRAAGGAAVAGMLTPYDPWLARAAAGGIRKPDSLPDPSRPAGHPTDALPFDHIVCLMQENHSFDNYFGMLPRRGQPLADGFTFDKHGVPLNSNPYKGGIARVLRAPSECQPTDVNQSWDDTHIEIDHGRMDGFAATIPGQMYYYDQPDIPFYYSFANTFTVGNRWFCSAPCQTFPNRRFYLCGTAFGLVSTDLSSVTSSPPNGTIVDRLNHYGISWKDYYVDVPGTAVIFDIPEKNLGNMATIGQFFTDCKTGDLPSVCWVDPEIGALNDAGSDLANQIPIGKGQANYAAAQDQDEENPADIQIGESFIEGVVKALIASPAWPRTLIVFIYDEHGGYYDHVPPPVAIEPDSIKPKLGPKDIPGAYNIYGPRVPCVVASPYSKPHGVCDTVCDHTSVLATIQAKWNLPACTYRDANAHTVGSFLQSRPELLEPPPLADTGDLSKGETDCDTFDPELKVLPAPKLPAVIAKVRRFERKRHALKIELHTNTGTLTNVEVELVRHGKVVARRRIKHLSTHHKQIALRGHRHRLGRGTYTLKILRGGRTLIRRAVHIR